MYLAATRYLVTKKARQLNSWNQRLPNYDVSASQLPTTKYALWSVTKRSYKHQAKPNKVTATGFGHLCKSVEPSLCKSGTARVDATSSLPYIKGPGDCSPYSFTTACLGPFIDGRHWYSEYEDAQQILENAKRHLKVNKAKMELNLDNVSLESLRKRIKAENLKNPEVPPGWERKK